MPGADAIDNANIRLVSEAIMNLGRGKYGKGRIGPPSALPSLKSSEPLLVSQRFIDWGRGTRQARSTSTLSKSLSWIMISMNIAPVSVCYHSVRVEGSY